MNFKNKNLSREFGAVLIVIVIIWLNGSFLDIRSSNIAGPLIALGRLAGLLAFYLILWQIMFIGRVGWIERAWGHDRLSRFHHFFGIVAIAILALHPILLTLGYSKLAQTTLTSQFLLFLSKYHYTISALIAYLMFLGIVVLSLWVIRKRLKYETWYYIHLTLYVAIILSFFHQIPNSHDLSGRVVGTYWWILFLATLANVLYYRFARPMLNLWRHQFRVGQIKKENENVLSIVINGKNLDRLKAYAGQFILVRFLAKNFYWEEHPFSLSEKPIGERFRITVKAVGDFTSKLATLPLGSRVFVEGPLGRFTADRAGKKKILLIAGGIGITPLRGLFEQFKTDNRPADLIYVARSENDFALKNELDQMTGINNKIYYIPEDKVGRLTPELIKNSIEDITERFIYLCGPPPMMKVVREYLKFLGVNKDLILYEKFQLG